MSMARPEKVQAVMSWLGSLATVADAEAVLEELEARGYSIEQEPGRGYVLRPAMDEDAWWQMVREVLSA